MGEQHTPCRELALLQWMLSFHPSLKSPGEKAERLGERGRERERERASVLSGACTVAWQLRVSPYLLVSGKLLV